MLDHRHTDEMCWRLAFGRLRGKSSSWPNHRCRISRQGSVLYVALIRMQAGQCVVCCPDKDAGRAVCCPDKDTEPWACGIFHRSAVLMFLLTAPSHVFTSDTISTFLSVLLALEQNHGDSPQLRPVLPVWTAGLSPTETCPSCLDCRAFPT